MKEIPLGKNVKHACILHTKIQGLNSSIPRAVRVLYACRLMCVIPSMVFFIHDRINLDTIIPKYRSYNFTIFSSIFITIKFNIVNSLDFLLQSSGMGDQVT